MNNIKDYDTMGYRSFMKKAERDKAFQTLRGIVDGISLDGRISDDEVLELKNWIGVNDQLSCHKPFDELISTISNALEDNVLTGDELEDILWVIDKCSTGGEYYDLTTLQIQRLEGICHGIIADNNVTEDEIISLNEWLSDNDFLLKGTYPYEEIRTLVLGVISDGIITEDECLLLKAYFAEFVDYEVSYNLDENELNNLRERYTVDGICSTHPEITFPGRLFCFTGKSSRMSRAEIAEVICAHGGEFKSSVQKKTNYLIVGDDGNPCWAYSCYGRKVEQANALRKEGVDIIIIHENDFWNQLEE